MKDEHYLKTSTTTRWIQTLHDEKHSSRPLRCNNLDGFLEKAGIDLNGLLDPRLDDEDVKSVILQCTQMSKGPRLGEAMTLLASVRELRNEVRRALAMCASCSHFASLLVVDTSNEILLYINIDIYIYICI